MKQLTLIFIVLLLAISSAYADGYPAEEAEHWEKVRQMDQLAERFKAETGFTGYISHDISRMCFGYYQGKFTGIQITATADTASFRAAFDQILDRVLPYTFAKREQLTQSRINDNLGIIQTDYYQQVNGYRVEGIGRLTINYEIGRNAFAIGNGTVELPDNDVMQALSYEDAVRIYDEHVEDDETTKSFRRRRPFLTLFYSNIYNDWEGDTRSEYRLCWVGGYTRCIYIDAHTGQVYKTVNKTKFNYQVNVTAKVMLDSDNSASFSTTSVPLDSTWVQALCDTMTVPVIDFTDNNGYYNFQCNTISGIESYLNSDCGIVVLENNNSAVMDNTSNLPNINYDYSNIQGNPSNLYYHALRYRDKIKRLFALINTSIYYDSTHIEPVILANYSLGVGENGSYTPNSGTNGIIKITAGNGNYNSTLCHEMTHDIVYRDLSFNFFNNSSNQDLDCMDETFSSYFPCMHRNNKNYRSQHYTRCLGDSLLTVAKIKKLEYPTSNINEDIYGFYHMRFPLASAWWDIRNIFPFTTTEFNAIDTLLVNSLNRVQNEIPQNNAYRYKPRYFYNILMSRVDNNSTSWPLNNKQIEINNAYNERGFHFYPEVMSAVSANLNNPVGRETYNVLDSVYVHIKNCPQNTLVKVSVVPDMDYGNVEASGIDMPSAIEVDGNPVCIVATTDSTGVWAGAIPFSNMLPQGVYDIIVDVGSPTAPDGRLNLVFANDNIIDGVDGLQEPGFTKIGFGDMVVALDLSSSMQGYATHLGKTQNPDRLLPMTFRNNFFSIE